MERVKEGKGESSISFKCSFLLNSILANDFPTLGLGLDLVSLGFGNQSPREFLLIFHPHQ